MSWWFPPGGPGNSNPIAAEIITTGSDPGWNGWFAPSRQNPLPVQVVAGNPPASVGNYPPSWTAPLALHQITGGAAPGGGYRGPFPPSAAYPMPVVVVTTGSDPGVRTWRPYTRAFPCPIVWV